MAPMLPEFSRQTIVWELHNFFEDKVNSLGKFITSTLFSVSLGSVDTRWHMNLYPSQSSKQNFISVSLFQHNRNVSDRLGINYQLSVLDANEEIVLTQAASPSVMDLKHGVGPLHWIPQSELFARSSKLLEKATLKIILRIELSMPSPAVFIAPCYPLSAQYKRLFNCEKHKDCTIITSDNKKIPVHKNILAIRSSVFEQMLEVKMELKHTVEVEVDADYKSMLEFLRFIYYGEVHDIEAVAADLLYISFKYDVRDLQEPCVAIVAKNIKTTNVVAILIIANLIEENDLKNLCYEFIKWNFNEISKLGTLSEMSQTLQGELMRSFANDYKPGTRVIRSNVDQIH